MLNINVFSISLIHLFLFSTFCFSMLWFDYFLLVFHFDNHSLAVSNLLLKLSTDLLILVIVFLSFRISVWFIFKPDISLCIGSSSLLKSKQLFYSLFLIISIFGVSIVMSLLLIISSGYHSWFFSSYA